MLESVARFEMMAVSAATLTVMMPLVVLNVHWVAGCVSFWARIRSTGSSEPVTGFVAPVEVGPLLELQPAAKARSRVPREARKVLDLENLVNVLLGIGGSPPSLVGQVTCTALLEFALTIW